MILRTTLRVPTAFAAALGTAAVVAALEYLWLFEEVPLAGDLFGVPFIATFLAPLVVLLATVRADLRDARAWRSLFGSISLWLAALGLPLLVFGGGLFAYWSAGGKVDPDWRWITLAYSALFDFPLMLLLCAPMLLGVEGAFRLVPALALGARMRAGASLLTALIAAASQLPLLLHLADLHTPLFAVGVAVAMVGTGAFAYRIQSRGAVVPATAAVLMSVTAGILLVGCDLPELLHAVIGFDVDLVKPLVATKSPFLVGIPAAAGIVLLLVSFLLSPRTYED